MKIENLLKEKNGVKFLQQRSLQKIVAVALFFVVGFYFISFYVDFSFKKPVSRYEFLNPARNFWHTEDLIINFQPLRDFLNQYEKNPNISIYFEFLNTGSNISVHQDAQFYPASLLKVPVAIAVAKKIERNDWRWDNKLVIMAGDNDDKFENMYKEQTGSTWTIEELVRRSLVDSDNTAHFILVRNLELAEIEDVYDHMGLKNFLLTRGDLSAKRYSVILRTLYNASYLSEGNSQKILQLLSLSEFKEYVQSGLPDNVLFVHKIGVSKEQNVFLDSGIVYAPNRPYVLTVIVKTADESEAKDIMKTVSAQIYKYVSEYQK